MYRVMPPWQLPGHPNGIYRYPPVNYRGRIDNGDYNEYRPRVAYDPRTGHPLPPSGYGDLGRGPGHRGFGYGHSIPMFIEPFDSCRRHPGRIPHLPVIHRDRGRRDDRAGDERDHRHDLLPGSIDRRGGFEGFTTSTGNSKHFAEDGLGPRFKVNDKTHYVNSMRELPKDFRVNFDKSRKKAYSPQTWQNLFDFINGKRIKSITQLGQGIPHVNGDRIKSITQLGQGVPHVTEDVQLCYLAKELKVDKLWRLVFEKLNAPGYAPGFIDFTNAVGYILARKEHGDQLYGWAQRFARKHPLHGEELFSHYHRLSRNSSLRHEWGIFFTKAYEATSGRGIRDSRK